MDLVSKDYSKSKLRPKRDFTSINSEISSKLTNTIELRIGGEIRLEKLSLRAGYTKLESPYKDSLTMTDSNSTSFGFGYDFDGILLSFSHKILKSNKNHSLFDSGLTDSAELMTKHSLSNISLIFKF